MIADYGADELVVKALGQPPKLNYVPQPRLPTASDERKQIPLTTGLLDYFPDALAAVARVSYKGNQKHNPGQPLHWSRGKSADHVDCIPRHLADRGFFDEDGELHEVHLAWRALALAQEALEKLHGLPPARGSTVPPDMGQKDWAPLPAMRCPGCGVSETQEHRLGCPCS